MTEPENLVIQMLRRIDTRLDRMEHRLEDLTARVGSLEKQCAQIRDTTWRIASNVSSGVSN
jgi:uncharacterized protein YoxC